jgi:hypothetical protein
MDPRFALWPVVLFLFILALSCTAYQEETIVKEDPFLLTERLESVVLVDGGEVRFDEAMGGRYEINVEVTGVLMNGDTVRLIGPEIKELRLNRVPATPPGAFMIRPRESSGASV